MLSHLYMRPYLQVFREFSFWHSYVILYLINKVGQLGLNGATGHLRLVQTRMQ